MMLRIRKKLKILLAIGLSAGIGATCARDYLQERHDLPPFDQLSLTAGVTNCEYSILQTYILAHQKLATALSELWQADLLLTDLYEILATIALFSFNRHGFPGERSAPIVTAVIANLDLA